MSPRENILNYLQNTSSKRMVFGKIVEETGLDYKSANSAATLMVKRGILTKYRNSGKVIYAINKKETV